MEPRKKRFTPAEEGARLEKYANEMASIKNEARGAKIWKSNKH